MLKRIKKILGISNETKATRTYPKKVTRAKVKRIKKLVLLDENGNAIIEGLNEADKDSTKE